MGAAGMAVKSPDGEEPAADLVEGRSSQLSASD